MRIRMLASAVAMLAMIFGVAAAQAAPRILTLANMSNDTPADNGDNEVDIAINPTNPANMIAGWNDYGVGNSCGVGYTLDGGKTWTTSWLRGMTPAGGNPTYDYGAGDPSVGFLNDGTAVFSCARHGERARASRARSSLPLDDGGQTWAPRSSDLRPEARPPRPPDADDRPVREPCARRLQRVERSPRALVRARLLDGGRHVRGRAVQHRRRLQVERP